MKYLIHVTASVSSTINGDNLRGEPRWERNVLDAFVSSGADVHTTIDLWKSPEPMPSNMHSGIVEEWLDDSVLITHGIMRNPHITSRAAHYVVQYHESPDAEHRHKFLKYEQEQPGHIIATTTSPADHYHGRLIRNLGAEKVEMVVGPVVPRVYSDADNWRKPIFLWSYRNFYTIARETPQTMTPIFSKVREWLEKEPNTRLVIIVGSWEHQELGHDPAPEVMKKWAFTYPFMNQLAPYANRVDVRANLPWHKVIDILKETRLIISPAEPLGCPAFEAGMFGIPTIVNQDINPFQSDDRKPFFPEVLVSPRKGPGAFLNQLERLYQDPVFYHIHGNAYRDYVGDNATYGAYVARMNEIFMKRGWM